MNSTIEVTIFMENVIYLQASIPQEKAFTFCCLT
jgi:sRNA-binding regulator protein Hfq